MLKGRGDGSAIWIADEGLILASGLSMNSGNLGPATWMYWDALVRSIVCAILYRRSLCVYAFSSSCYLDASFALSQDTD